MFLAFSVGPARPFGAGPGGGSQGARTRRRPRGLPRSSAGRGYSYTERGTTLSTIVAAATAADEHPNQADEALRQSREADARRAGQQQGGGAR